MKLFSRSALVFTLFFSLVSLTHATYENAIHLCGDNEFLAGNDGNPVCKDVQGILNLIGTCGNGKVLKYDGINWSCQDDLIGGSGTITNISTENGITGGPITTSGTIGLTGQALALHNLAINGFIVRTGNATIASRSLAQGSGITITNSDGIAGNPTIGHTNSITAGTASEGGTARTLTFGGTFNIPSVTYDTEGHITEKGTTTLTMPAAPTDGDTSATNEIQTISVSGTTPNKQIDLSLSGGSATCQALTGAAELCDGSDAVGLTSIFWDTIQNGVDVYMHYNPGGTACTNGQILKWNGSEWMCGNEAPDEDNQLLFSTVHAPVGADIEADSVTDTLNFTTGSGITITSDSASDTFEFTVNDVSSSNELQNLFKTINTPDGTFPVADAQDDTLEFIAGNGISIIGDETNDRITIATTKSIRTATGTTDTITATDDVILCDNATGVTLAITPTAAASTGKEFVIKNINASGSCTIDPAGTETIDGTGTKVLSGKWQSTRIISNGTAWFIE